MPTVVNLYKDDYTVYIGRPGKGQPPNKWYNPFRVGVDGDHNEVIRRYKRHLWQQIQSGEISLEELAALKGEVLGCFCKPKPCHGDVLAAASEWACRELEKQKNAAG